MRQLPHLPHCGYGPVWGGGGQLRRSCLCYSVFCLKALFLIELPLVKAIDEKLRHVLLLNFNAFYRLDNNWINYKKEKRLNSCSVPL